MSAGSLHSLGGYKNVLCNVAISKVWHSGTASFYAQYEKLEEEVDDFAECEHCSSNDETERSTKITQQCLDRIRSFRLDERVLHLWEKYLHNTGINVHFDTKCAALTSNKVFGVAPGESVNTYTIRPIMGKHDIHKTGNT